MNATININVSITVQIPEVIVRLPTLPTPAPTKQSKEEDGFEYIQHRMRIYNKIKLMFGSEAATQYLAGAL
ncbi:hypothetical protein D3C73_1629140 [compost metagenome]